MIVITVARKPVVGTVANTITTFGTSGLDIDACRIGAFQNTTPNGSNRFHVMNAIHGYRPRSYFQPEKAPTGERGRWPANVILEHRSGCQLTGTARVAATSIGNPKGAKRRDSPYSSVGGYYTPGEIIKVTGYGDAEGMENVDTWICVEGCPVSSLDSQSGVTLSTGGQWMKSQVGKSSVGFGYAHSGKQRGDNLGGFGDVGGASRYFKAIGGNR